MSSTQAPRDSLPSKLENAASVAGRIRQQLADGDLAAAELELQAAGKRWPRQPVFAEEQMALRLAQRQAADAIAIGQQTLALHPDRPRALALLVEAHIQAGDAHAAIAAAIAHGVQPWPQALLLQLLACWRSLGQESEALAAIQRWVAAQPESLPLRALLNRLPGTSAADHAFAMEVAKVGCRRWPVDTQMLSRAARVAMVRGSWAEASHWLERYTRLRPEALGEHMHLANIAFFESGDLPLAVRAAEMALTCDPHQVGMRLLAAHVRFLLDDQEGALRHATAGFEDPSANDEQRWMLASLIQACDRRPQAEARLREALRIESDSPPFVFMQHGVQAWIPAGAETVVVYFGSVNYSWSLGFNELRSILPAGTGLVFLQDFARLYFMGGVASLGKDFDATVEALREMIPSSTKSLLSLGFSGGGYAAMLYGLALGARSYLLFAALTDGHPEAILLPDAISPRYRRIRAMSPTLLMNMREAFSARPERPRMDLWFGGDSPWDRRNAERMSGMQNVHLHAIPGCDTHDLLGFMQANGTLEPVLREWLGRGD